MSIPINFRPAAKDIEGESHDHADDQGSHQHEEALLFCIIGFEDVIQKGCVAGGLG